MEDVDLSEDEIAELIEDVDLSEDEIAELIDATDSPSDLTLPQELWNFGDQEVRVPILAYLTVIKSPRLVEKLLKAGADPNKVFSYFDNDDEWEITSTPFLTVLEGGSSLNLTNLGDYEDWSVEETEKFLQQTLEILKLMLVYGADPWLQAAGWEPESVTPGNQLNAHELIDEERKLLQLKTKLEDATGPEDSWSERQRGIVRLWEDYYREDLPALFSPRVKARRARFVKPYRTRFARGALARSNSDHKAASRLLLH